MLSATIASILSGLIYINCWQWLLIRKTEKKENALITAYLSDTIYSILMVIAAFITWNWGEAIYEELNVKLACSCILGIALSQQSLYIAHFREKNKFSPPAFIALLAECVRAGLIITACISSNGSEETLSLISKLLWIFGAPHFLMNMICFLSTKERLKIPPITILLDFFQYNFYLHTKNLSDLFINHFDKIIINYHMGLTGLATYDLIKKIGFAISKLLSPAQPLIFKELVDAEHNKQKIISIKNKYTPIFMGASIFTYFMLELGIYISSFFYDYEAITFIQKNSTEIRLYIACQLLGFSFCFYHLALGAIGETKIESKVTWAANLIFLFLFYLLSQISLAAAIFAIIIQYASLILIKARLLKWVL